MSKLVAQLGMKEFDPTKERHFPVIVVKVVDPGCTLELQIENAVTGEVVRMTTTEDVVADRLAFEEAILTTFAKACAAREKTIYEK